MIQRIAIVALALLAAGCARTFPERFESIQVGFTQEQVHELLGEPKNKRPMLIRKEDGHVFGPQEGLPRDVEFEEWSYEEGDYKYYVWFSKTTGGEIRKVHSKTRHESSAVF